MNLVTTQIQSHMLHLCWPFLCDFIVDFPFTSQQYSFLLLYCLLLILCNNCLCQKISFQWKKKINKFEIFNRSVGYVMEFWGITLSDSEMEAVCSSEAMILTYKMTYFYTRKASIWKSLVMLLLLVGLAKTIFWATYNSVWSNKNRGVVVTSAAEVRNVVGVIPFQSLCTF